MHIAVFLDPGPTRSILLHPLQQNGHTCQPFSSIAAFLAQSQEQIASFDAFLVDPSWKEASPQHGLLWHLLALCPNLPCMLLSRTSSQVKDLIALHFPHVQVLTVPISASELQQAFSHPRRHQA